MISITLGGCSAFTPCGGDVAGTWNLVAGCIDDPLATSKSLCPALVVNSETATGSGSVTFVGSIVTRSYTTHYAMDVTVPPACLTVYSCSQIQAGYQQYIANTSCATDTNGACRCTGSIDSNAQQGSTYTTSNNEIVTGGGDHYAYCVNGNTLQYKHVSGPTSEIGSYTLQK